MFTNSQTNQKSYRPYCTGFMQVLQMERISEVSGNDLGYELVPHVEL